MRGRLLPCGQSAVLVELEGLSDVMALHGALRARRGKLTGLLDLVPAATTVLVVARDPAALPSLRREVAEVLRRAQPPPPGARADSGVTVRVEVRYDGADLDEVASLTGLTRAEVVRAHTCAPWTVAFCGFAPGFAYLTGGDTRLEVPRRREPRTRVPAGSVALAGTFSGIYPRSSPGGWQVIGHTDAVVWDTDRDPPALLRPGDAVAFVDVTPW